MELPRIIQTIFVEPAEKQRRLSICKNCDKKSSFAGQLTCGLCGCFLEVKAGLIGFHCADNPPKW
jgi:hypothetical protein